jgi:alpha-tubulin suppressor-like RCC1 family protein
MKNKFYGLSNTFRCFANLATLLPAICAVNMAFSQVAAPIFDPIAGQSNVGFYVAVSSSTPECDIHYTTNGLEPTKNDPKIPATNLLLISRNLTIKAKAWAGESASQVTTAQYQVTGAIVAGGTHAIAVKSNKAVYSWGNSNYGKLANGLGTSTDFINPALAKYSAAASDILANGTDCAAGLHHSLVLDENGYVRSFGSNSAAQLGINSLGTSTYYYPYFVRRSAITGDYLLNIESIAASGNYSAAVSASGEVYTWGDKANFRLGRAVASNDNYFAKQVRTNSTTNLTGIRQIACGGSHMLARTPHPSESQGGLGQLWVWGTNSNGQLGLGNTTNQTYATLLSSITGVHDMSAGASHSVIVRWDATYQGAVFCFGSEEYGKLGNNVSSTAFRGITTNKTTPVATLKAVGVPLTGIVQVSAGPEHTLALDSQGCVWAWGNNAAGALGDNTTTNQKMAVQVKAPSGTGFLGNIVKVSAGGDSTNGVSFAIAADGTVYAWGRNANGQLGLGHKTSPVKLPTVVPNLKLTNSASPVVSLTSTLTQAHEPAVLNLTATATDADGANDISHVVFECNGLVVATASSSPYTASVPSLHGGNHTVKATAYDLAGTSHSVIHTISVKSVVNLELIDGIATENGSDHGMIRLKRGNANSSDLPVSLVLSGTAANSVDYETVSLTAMIPAGADHLNIPIIAKIDYLSEPEEDLVVSVAASLAYVTGSQPTATVIIMDHLVYDGDGLTEEQERALGTSPILADTDGDGVNDDVDEFPLDPSRSTFSPTSGDMQAPLVTLVSPTSAVCISGP